MPIYEYQCEACHHHLEALRKISDAPLRKCPACGRSKLKRLLSPPVFRLKGSGWYETDFKSDKEGRRNLAGPEKDDAGSTASTADAKAAQYGDDKNGDDKNGDDKKGADDKKGPDDKLAPAKPVESTAEKAKPEAASNAARKSRKSVPKPKSRTRAAASGKGRR